MHFLTLVVKNLLRRKVRTALTCVGLAVAVAAVVSLVGISQGFERSFGELFLARGVDMLVFRSGTSARITSSIPTELRSRLTELEGVEKVTGILIDAAEIRDANVLGVPIQGWEPGSFMFQGLKLAEGRWFVNQEDKTKLPEVVLGALLARSLNKPVGSTVNIYGQPCSVVGIYESFNLFENGSVLVPLADLQDVMQRKNQVTGFLIVLQETKDKAALVARLSKEIEALTDDEGQTLGLVGMATRDHVHTTFEIRFTRAMAWLTSTIAIIIGAVGVLNTMMMSVAERTREVGILRAVGWRRRRVMAMIVCESVTLSLIGATLGTIAATVMTFVLSQVPLAAGMVRGDLDPMIIGLGFGTAVFVGLTGGIYPAFVAASVPPADALRHE